MAPDVQALLGLVSNLCSDLAAMFPSLSKGLARDLKYVRSRVEAEGLFFLTSVLPLIGKAFDVWLKSERGAPSFDVPYLNPLFLSGIKELAGKEIELHDRAYLYRWLRQFCYLCYKLDVPYSEEQLRDAFRKFKEVDDGLEASDQAIDIVNACAVGEVIGTTLADFKATDLVPRHGPGAVATGEVGDEKWAFKRLYRSVHRKFPMYDYFVPTLSSWSNDPGTMLKWYRSLQRLDYPEARVVAVPKDSRGPRLISEEPLELQYMQQSYLHQLVPYLETSSPAAGFVNFTDQSVNQRLALDGSLHGGWATIDLADASDRVSDYLVYLTFPDRIYEEVRALRSYSTVLPDGTRQRLRKFAPMGSAICFPVEALLFWAISRSSLIAIDRDDPVYVYGDDIIVPVDVCRTVCQALESFGLKVNESKTYDTGSFRESCGLDAWFGFEITPGRLRQMPPLHGRDHAGLANWTSVGNHLRKWDFHHAAAFVHQTVEKVVKLPWNILGTALTHCDDGPHPFVDPRNAGFRKRIHSHYQRGEVLSLALRSVSTPTSLDGWQRLHRNLVQPPLTPSETTKRATTRARTRWNKI